VVDEVQPDAVSVRAGTGHLGLQVDVDPIEPELQPPRAEWTEDPLHAGQSEPIGQMSVRARVARDEQIRPAVAELGGRRPQFVQEARLGRVRSSAPDQSGRSNEEVHRRAGFMEQHGGLEGRLTPSDHCDGLATESGQIVVIARVADAPARPFPLLGRGPELRRHVRERRRADGDDDRCRANPLAGSELDVDSGA